MRNIPQHLSRPVNPLYLDIFPLRYDIPIKSVTMSAIQSIFAEDKFNQTLKSE